MARSFSPSPRISTSTRQVVLPRWSQLRKYKTKIIAKHQDGGNFKKEFLENEDAGEQAEEIKIIRTKHFGIKPMYPEDACVQMELLGHNFYVFRNAETEEVNVVYKRKGNTYGLIEPEF